MSLFGPTARMLGDLLVEGGKTLAWLALVVYAILALRAISQLPGRIDRLASAVRGEPEWETLWVGVPTVDTNGVCTVPQREAAQ